MFLLQIPADFVDVGMSFTFVVVSSTEFSTVFSTEVLIVLSIVVIFSSSCSSSCSTENTLFGMHIKIVATVSIANHSGWVDRI